MPLAPKLLVACVDAMEDWLIKRLREQGFEFVDVGYAEAKNLGVNLVALGSTRTCRCSLSVAVVCTACRRRCVATRSESQP